MHACLKFPEVFKKTTGHLYVLINFSAITTVSHNLAHPCLLALVLLIDRGLFLLHWRMGVRTPMSWCHVLQCTGLELAFKGFSSPLSPSSDHCWCLALPPSLSIVQALVIHLLGPGTFFFIFSLKWWWRRKCFSPILHYGTGNGQLDMVCC